MINLVENASKYGKQNGTVTASIYVTDDRHALVEIGAIYDGIGIEEEHLPRILKDFTGPTWHAAGTRAALDWASRICKHIIEAHGQSIHVRSTPDVGTTIGFTLGLTSGLS